MKTNHHKPAVRASTERFDRPERLTVEGLSRMSLSNPLCTVLLAVTLLVLLTSTSAHADYVVVVPADPLWTDTELSLNTGDVVSITASGSWITSLGWPAAGPDGYPGDTGTDGFCSWALHSALIAYVGSDPYQGHWGDASFFPQTNGYWNIGSSAQFTSDKTGELWLGINDDAVSQCTFDNSGSMTALISVIPEPATIGLLGLGGLALLRKRRK